MASEDSNVGYARSVVCVSLKWRDVVRKGEVRESILDADGVTDSVAPII